MNNRKRMIQRAQRKNRLSQRKTFLNDVHFAFGDELCNRIRDAENAFRALRDTVLKVPSILSHAAYQSFVLGRYNITPKEAD